MTNLAQNLNANGVVVVEPVTLRPGHSFEALREAVSLFSQTLKKHKIASGFLGSFVVLDNPEPTGPDLTGPDLSGEDDNLKTGGLVLLSFFWASQHALDLSQDNPLYQVLLDDVLSHCLSSEGKQLRAPGLVTERYAPLQVSGLKNEGEDPGAHHLKSHAIH